MKKYLLPILGLVLISPILISCGGGSNPDPSNTSNSQVDPSKPYFTYEDISFVDTIGEHTNDEVQDYNSIRVNPVEVDLREDFAFGMDVSMVNQVEKLGGIYYNEEGKEQDIFQILRKEGVNFVRFREWVRPTDKLKLHPFGGGNNDLSTNIKLAKRAKAANLNVMIDFHYSDFWADPDYQNRPMEWQSLSHAEVASKIESYTRDSLDEFKNQGITVDAVQIGNETNNGMCGYTINWNNTKDSFDMIANYIKGGIKGAKDVFPNIKTIVHLANGGNTEEFENYFTNLDSRGVNYDIIGASYYPHLSGSLDELQDNLENVTQKTGKPAMVVETSWGFTDDYVVREDNGAGNYKTLKYNQAMGANDVQITANSYSNADEEVGGYLTSVQAQVTELRDIINTLAKVKDNRGLGIFYWEPAWLPVGELNKKGEMDYAGWATTYGQSYQNYSDLSHLSLYKDGLATWSNQGLFSYTGKALPSLKTYSLVKDGKNSKTETSISPRRTNLEVTINLAADETLPATAKVVTDFDAIRTKEVVWEAEAIETVKHKGTFTGLKGKLDGKFDITCTAKCIENHIKDPGFEEQGAGDSVRDPWVIESSTPVGDKVIKLDRKKDIRNGKTDLNWFHSSEEFTFKVSQTVNLKAGTYALTTYVMAESMSKYKHLEFVLFYQIGSNDVVEVDFCDDAHISGWSNGYKTLNVPSIVLDTANTLKVGLRGRAEANAWGHNDDWELVTIED